MPRVVPGAVPDAVPGVIGVPNSSPSLETVAQKSWVMSTFRPGFASPSFFSNQAMLCWTFVLTFASISLSSWAIFVRSSSTVDCVTGSTGVSVEAAVLPCLPTNQSGRFFFFLGTSSAASFPSFVIFSTDSYKRKFCQVYRGRGKMSSNIYTLEDNLLTIFFLIAFGLNLYSCPGLRLRLSTKILASDGDLWFGSSSFCQVTETTLHS